MSINIILNNLLVPLVYESLLYIAHACLCDPHDGTTCMFDLIEF